MYPYARGACVGQVERSVILRKAHIVHLLVHCRSVHGRVATAWDSHEMRSHGLPLLGCTYGFRRCAATSLLVRVVKTNWSLYTATALGNGRPDMLPAQEGEIPLERDMSSDMCERREERERRDAKGRWGGLGVAWPVKLVDKGELEDRSRTGDQRSWKIPRRSSSAVRSNEASGKSGRRAQDECSGQEEE